jgi:hypothetical protein
MYFLKYEDSYKRGLEHVGNCAYIHQKAVDFLNQKKGSRSGCLRGLSSDVYAISMNTFFKESNLNLMKQWMYVAGKLNIMLHHIEPEASYLSELLLWVLISDNEELINWYRQHEAMYHPKNPSIAGGDKDNPKSWMYYRYQSWLALNARWDELGARCEHILGMQDEIKKDRSSLIDHRFYLALAKGNKSEMQAVLLEKCDPKNRKRSHDQESGLTHNFIVSYATLFAKLAWRNGYELDLDTPWIPKDWLPVQPLQTYEDPWPFMQSFDIWQPLEGEWAKWSPQRKAQTP